MSLDKIDNIKSESLNDMYSSWFLDYASYVILERAVPHISDGLKPVQRRILHSLKEKDDGRFNKVANIIGHTMQYHPHGDQAIGSALINIGQKELVLDTQGNWGNILTGDSSAAPRYIEVKLSKFANEVFFNHNITKWDLSYDSRNKEPVYLPIKFPLLLAHGAEGIAVGLACKILPHNFNELIDACICYLKNQKYEIFPDFLQGGIIDVSSYNDGLRGGKVKLRARINKVSKKELIISEIPFGTTSLSLCESILRANDQGKIKISKIEDCTADKVEIHVFLPIGSDLDKTIQGLYAFSDCEVSISPNACVIDDDKPKFWGVSKILEYSANKTRNLIKDELEIKLLETENKLHFLNLEKIFIEKKIYRKIEEADTWKKVINQIKEGFKPYLEKIDKKITEKDVVKLTEIKIKRISKYDSFKSNEIIISLENKIKEINKNLKNLTNYTIKWFEKLKNEYGKDKHRRTEIGEFKKVKVEEVAQSNETLYFNKKEGFIGYDMNKDLKSIAIDKCSKFDDVITFSKKGIMKVLKISDKVFVGKDIILVHIFSKKNNKFYNMIYRDGKTGNTMVKRFQINGITREKLYYLAGENSNSKVLWLSSHDSEQESNIWTKVNLKSDLKLRNYQIDFQFSKINFKSKLAKGNILTKNQVEKISKMSKLDQKNKEENLK